MDENAELTPQEQIPKKNVQLLKFERILNQVLNHPYVSLQTKDKRKEFRDIDISVKDYLKQLGITESAVIPIGSVAVGMAIDKSDLDGTIFYNGQLGQQIESQKLTGLNLPPDIKMFNITDLLQDDESFKRKINIALAVKRPTTMANIAMIFFPSLNEMTNNAERELVHSWRKATLEKIVKIYPNNYKKVWDLVTTYVDINLIHYENLRSSGDDNKRQDRVQKMLDEKITERFPNDERSQQRAYTYIQKERALFAYPPIEDMLYAYEINLK